ncbi:unnamed protein product [Rhizophagus irregularis]|nr:unnamed protein product [Rhizophagus irregularis]CAB5360331.1 unnamed protein product [Rhizophagus irregularis]
MHLYNSQKVSISTIKQIFWIYQSLLIEGAGDANDNYLPYLILTNEQILNFPLGILMGGNRDGYFMNLNVFLEGNKDEGFLHRKCWVKW